MAPAKVGSCLVCGNEFERRTHGDRNRKFCSDECAREAKSASQRARRILQIGDISSTCQQCGNEFTPEFRRDQKFCSAECRQQFANDAKPRTSWAEGGCARCGGRFARWDKTGGNAKYCSHKCKQDAGHAAAEVRRQTRRAGRMSDCVVCGGKCRRVGDSTCSKPCADKLANARHHQGHVARAKKVGARWERVNRIAVFDRDGWRCQICGCSTPKARRGTKHPRAPELDHRIPLAQGGDHTYDNVQCTCRQCNRAKAAKHVRGQLPLFPNPALAGV